VATLEQAAAFYANSSPPKEAPSRRAHYFIAAGVISRPRSSQVLNADARSESLYFAMKDVDASTRCTELKALAPYKVNGDPEEGEEAPGPSARSTSSIRWATTSASSKTERSTPKSRADRHSPSTRHPARAFSGG